MRSWYPILFLAIFVALSSDVFGLGVGLRWSTEAITLKFGETRCIEYGVYNPFGENSVIRLQTTGNITELVAVVEPAEVLVPAGTSSGNAVKVNLCLYGKRGNFPYKPAVYKGDVLAAIMGSQVGGSGSAVGASVAATLEVWVGDLTLYNRIRNGATALALIIIGSISYTGYRRYKRKKWESTIRNECPTCKRTFPYDSKFCPHDGTALVKYKGDQRLE